MDSPSPKSNIDLANEEKAQREAALAKKDEQRSLLARDQANMASANELVMLRHLQREQIRANPIPVPGNPLGLRLIKSIGKEIFDPSQENHPGSENLFALGVGAGKLLSNKGLTASILRKVSGEYVEHTLDNAIERTVEMLKEGKVSFNVRRDGESLKELVLDPEALKKTGQSVKDVLKTFLDNVKEEVGASSLKGTAFGIFGEKAQERLEEALVGKRGRRALKFGRMVMD